MKRTLSILAVIAWGMMAACNKMDNNTEPQTPVVYTVSIPANSWHSATNANDNTAEVDVSAQLAADGYTVIRSARTDNADGTYTWTYTVAPME